jgi:hypothetical protein
MNVSRDGILAGLARLAAERSVVYGPWSVYPACRQAGLKTA